MSKNLNKNVADFEHNGRKYAVDLLLDSICNGYASYDIFDVTEDKLGKLVGQLYLEQQEESDYTPSDLIKLAIKEMHTELKVGEL